MSVRNGLLALLAEQPMHGYHLRQEFERRTGGTWPLNIGQVYTTLHRLVRDGLAEPVPQGGTGTEGAGADVELFRLTDAGRTEARACWATPVGRGAPARDELAIKLAHAVTAAGVDVGAVLQAQRTETMRALRDYTRLKVTGGPSAEQGAANPDADLAWSLVLDSLVFAAEAEVRWLDHVEARVTRAARERADRAAARRDVPAEEPFDGGLTRPVEDAGPAHDAGRAVR